MSATRKTRGGGVGGGLGARCSGARCHARALPARRTHAGPPRRAPCLRRAAVEQWSALSKEQQDEYKKQVGCVGPGGCDCLMVTWSDWSTSLHSWAGLKLRASETPPLLCPRPPRPGAQVAEEGAAGGEGEEQEHSAEPSAEAGGDDSGSSDSDDSDDSDE